MFFFLINYRARTDVVKVIAGLAALARCDRVDFYIRFFFISVLLAAETSGSREVFFYATTITRRTSRLSVRIDATELTIGRKRAGSTDDEEERHRGT